VELALAPALEVEPGRLGALLELELAAELEPVLAQELAAEPGPPEAPALEAEAEQAPELDQDQELAQVLDQAGALDLDQVQDPAQDLALVLDQVGELVAALATETVVPACQLAQAQAGEPVLVLAPAADLAQVLELDLAQAGEVDLEADQDRAQEQVPAPAQVSALEAVVPVVLAQEQAEMAAAAVETATAAQEALAAGVAGDLAAPVLEVKMTTTTTMMMQSCFRDQVVKNSVNPAPQTQHPTS